MLQVDKQNHFHGLSRGSGFWVRVGPRDPGNHCLKPEHWGPASQPARMMAASARCGLAVASRALNSKLNVGGPPLVHSRRGASLLSTPHTLSKRDVRQFHHTALSCANQNTSWQGLEAPLLLEAPVQPVLDCSETWKGHSVAYSRGRHAGQRPH